MYINKVSGYSSHRLFNIGQHVSISPNGPNNCDGSIQLESSIQNFNVLFRNLH